MALAAVLCAIALVAGPAQARPVPTAAPPTTSLHDDSRPDAAQTPTAGPVRPVPGAVVRPFDPPDHPYGPGHRGVDLAAAPGDAVRAVLAGDVTFAGDVAGVGWVTVDHGGGLSTTYGPVTATATAGQHVVAGARVAALSDGATHLDWGARLHGAYLDPLDLLVRWSARLTRLPADVGR